MVRLDLAECSSIPGGNYHTPKEVWGFPCVPEKGRPEAIARRFLQTNAALFKIPRSLEGLRCQRVVPGLRATHVIFAQYYKGAPVFRAYVTVHIGRRGAGYFIKNRAVPQQVLTRARARRLTAAAARRRALREVGRTAAHSEARRRTLAIWFPRGRQVHPAWRIHVQQRDPRAVRVVIVHGISGKLLHNENVRATRLGKGLVFRPHPMAHDPVFVPYIGQRIDRRTVGQPRRESHVAVTLRNLGSSGYLDGVHVSTRPTSPRLYRPKGDFRVRSAEFGFEEVSAFYHVDRAVEHVQSLGYVGSRRIFKAPLPVDALATEDDDSWFDPEDGTLNFGVGDVNDAEDGETVLHEFGHALQDAIGPFFGQRPEARAIGEGFGDYFAASYFESRKRALYRATVMSWDGVTFSGRPPCVRRLDSKKTFRAFERGRWADAHDNGEIWSATPCHPRRGAKPVRRTLCRSRHAHFSPATNRP